ncbi:hypothetical protein LX59_02715 [Azomonas agilis]|uniref:Uncharacterized protein n=1 Tax=Azomonas agilis TaxID=116849 RepID=A0A562I0B2_9GAMM|nr:hypothetical protein [Azomonas agilis]TWH64164.1 hypothetical protein LX59_02715 [Azomonas agilis]
MTNPASARHERLTALFQQTYALFLWKTNPTTECETALEPFFMKPTLLLGESAPMPALPEIIPTSHNPAIAYQLYNQM